MAGGPGRIGEFAAEAARLRAQRAEAKIDWAFGTPPAPTPEAPLFHGTNFGAGADPGRLPKSELGGDVSRYAAFGGEPTVPAGNDRHFWDLLDQDAADADARARQRIREEAEREQARIATDSANLALLSSSPFEDELGLGFGATNDWLQGGYGTGGLDSGFDALDPISSGLDDFGVF